jgi:VanZ family protein
MTNSNSSNKWRGRVLRYAPLILWIGVIFLLSSTQGAMQNTSRFIRPLLEWLFPDAPAETITVYHAFIRKCAHFTEYAVLAFWAWRAFKGRREGEKEKRGKGEKGTLARNWVWFSLALVLLVASIDEFNQSFNSARTGSVYDILLDASGGLSAILFLWFFTKKQSPTTDF